LSSASGAGSWGRRNRHRTAFNTHRRWCRHQGQNVVGFTVWGKPSRGLGWFPIPTPAQFTLAAGTFGPRVDSRQMCSQARAARRSLRSSCGRGSDSRRDVGPIENDWGPLISSMLVAIVPSGGDPAGWAQSAGHPLLALHFLAREKINTTLSRRPPAQQFFREVGCGPGDSPVSPRLPSLVL